MTKITLDKDLIAQAVEAHAWALDHLPNGAAQTKVRASIKALEVALAEPVVEPVAVVDANDDGYWAEILPDRGVKVGQLLYASPPPPAEVPLLSDEEIGALVREASKGGALNRDGSTSQRIARAIEQAVRRNAGLK